MYVDVSEGYQAAHFGSVLAKGIWRRVEER